MNLSGITQIFGELRFKSGSVFSTPINAGVGKVWTSDGVGTGSWKLVGSGQRVSKEIQINSHGFNAKDVLGWSGGSYNKAIADGTYDG